MAADSSTYGRPAASRPAASRPACGLPACGLPACGLPACGLPACGLPDTQPSVALVVAIGRAPRWRAATRPYPPPAWSGRHCLQRGAQAAGIFGGLGLVGVLDPGPEEAAQAVALGPGH